MQTEGEAQHAVTEGRNIPIMGRHCRTEIARVNRKSCQLASPWSITNSLSVGTLYLSRISGGDISHEEARQILNGYGAIEELHHASSAERALYGLPQGSPATPFSFLLLMISPRYFCKVPLL